MNFFLIKNNHIVIIPIHCVAIDEHYSIILCRKLNSQKYYCVGFTTVGYSFYINNVKDLSLEDVINQSKLVGLSFLQEYDEPSKGFWPQNFAYVYIKEKTVRALETKIDNHRMHIRIFAGSSPNDYQLAIKLTMAIAEISHGKISPENQGELSLQKFRETYNISWVKEHCRSMVSMLLSQQIKNPTSISQISGVGKAFKIGPNLMADLRKDKFGLINGFFSRLKRLNYLAQEDVYQAPITVLESEKTKQKVRVSTYSKGVMTLIHNKNTVITLTNTPDDPINHEDSAQIFIPTQKIAELLTNNTLWLSEDLLLLPKLSHENWQDLLNRSQEVSIELFDYGYDPQNDPFESTALETTEPQETTEQQETTDLTKDELLTLAYAPIIAFTLVGAAKGQADPGKMTSFKEELTRGLTVESELLQKAGSLCAENFESYTSKLANREVEVQSKIRQILQILSGKVSDNNSLLFRSELISLGEKAAKPPAGLLGMFNKKMSDEEIIAIKTLTALFEIEK